MRTYYVIISIIFFVGLSACNTKTPTQNVEEIKRLPVIFPDYADVTIPPNIAPLNFHIEEKGTQYLAKLTGANGMSLVEASKTGNICFNMHRWKKLLHQNIGKQLTVDVYVKSEIGKWQHHQSFLFNVADEEIDSHLAYRIINVGYVLWKKLGLYQRDLTSFKETPIMMNRNSDGNCMNCHSFCANDPEKFMFHMRGKHGGTLISTPDSTFKIDSKTANTISAGAYPAWHPDGKHIAFSLNMVRQFFHGVDKRNEVYDNASDMVVYDIEKNTIITTPALTTPLREALPNWSPDGKYLYFCRAPESNDSLSFDQIFYDLIRIKFDATTNTWGKLDTILLASELKGTITWPKISPDGKYVLFTRGSHGYFTIFNSTSDLYFLDLSSGAVMPFEFNSTDVDSYHTWSSNGRWFVFSSKRQNGLTTRPFISYFDKNGKAHKPFVVPQKDPQFYKSFMNNYNVPELITGPVNVNKQTLLKSVFEKASSVTFDNKVSLNNINETVDSLGGTLQ